jgi:UPF0755 protein
VSENWPQGGSGAYGDDPYAQPEPREATGPTGQGQGRGRRRADGPPPAQSAQSQSQAQPQPQPPRAAPRGRPQSPQDPYGQAQYGQNPYGPDGYGQNQSQGPSYGADSNSGSYPVGQYPGPPAADPYGADLYSSGSGYPQGAAQPRRPQPPQPAQPLQPPQSMRQPQRPQSGRAPYGAEPQAARDSYTTGLNDASTGLFESQSYDRRPTEPPAYERQPYDRRAGAQGQAYDAQGYESQGYESQSFDRPAYAREPYEQDPYQDDPRSAGAAGQTGRRRAAGEPVPDEHDPYYARDEVEAPAQPRSRRRGGRQEQDPDHFRLIDEDEDDFDDGQDGGGGGGGGGRRPGRPTQPKRGRNCLAVFVAFAVIAGGIGYGGFKGYQWYQGRHSTPADYTATTNAAYIDVVIPTGSNGTDIGDILYKANVIKSEGAFINACSANVQCPMIEANTYLLPEQISAAAAVTMLLNPSSVDTKGQLITYGGERAAQVFAELEAKKGWTAASITAAMNSGQIGLPSWDTAKAGADFPYAPIEGFICAEQYQLGTYSTPVALLEKMVADQLAELTTTNFAARATALGVSEYQLLIIASMAQAEAATPTDYGMIAEVVFNRLKDKDDFAHLGFDTVTLYGMGNTVTSPTESDLENASNPYNTHLIVGLPPGPIGNPDKPALTAAANPTVNSNLYFCAINSTTTEYAATNQAWAALGRQYPKQCGGG